MSTSVKNKVTAAYESGYIVIRMESGVEIKFPVSVNNRLSRGTERQLNHIEISPYGIHRPDLDEDLSFKGLLAGNYGQYVGSETSHCSRQTTV